jgi:hypothetical protein
MIDRTSITWDLSRGGHALTVYWTEPSEKPSVPARRTTVFESDSPWEPWQITGIITSLTAGKPLHEVVPGPQPRISRVRRAATKVGDSFINLIDQLTAGHRLEGGIR